MPDKYERIRDYYISQGDSEDEAKEKAAKIYNKQRKPGEEPVTRNYEKLKSEKDKK